MKLFHERNEWLPGPWTDEPDHLEWRDEETGYLCVIHRVKESGYLCGYVGILPDHPLHGICYNADNSCLSCEGMEGVDIGKRGAIEVFCYALDPEHRVRPAVYFDVHGSLTYSEPSAPFSVACATWWFGFDCAHCDDICPGRLGTDLHSSFPGAVYRDLGCVKAECRSLAQQLKEVHETWRRRRDKANHPHEGRA